MFFRTQECEILAFFFFFDKLFSKLWMGGDFCEKVSISYDICSVPGIVASGTGVESVDVVFPLAAAGYV